MYLFSLKVILISLSTQGPGLLYLPSGLSSRLPVSHTHSVFDPLKEKKHLEELVENFTHSSTQKRDKKKALVNFVMA